MQRGWKSQSDDDDDWWTIPSQVVAGDDAKVLQPTKHSRVLLAQLGWVWKPRRGLLLLGGAVHVYVLTLHF